METDLLDSCSDEAGVFRFSLVLLAENAPETTFGLDWQNQCMNWKKHGTRIQNWIDGRRRKTAA